jgi:magnesium transporter
MTMYTLLLLVTEANQLYFIVHRVTHSLISAAFLCYAASALAVSLILMLHCAPRYGQTNIVVYVGICSVIGSLTVNNVGIPLIPTYTFVFLLECLLPLFC